MVEEFHKLENAEMHQKSLVQSVLHLAPILTKVVEQGISECIMSVEYPHETVELLLSCAVVIFDDGLFEWGAENMARKVNAFINMAEVSLGTEKGALSEMMELFG